MSESLQPDGYVLGRDYAASSRLNYQFNLWKETLQFKLHPSVPLQGPEEKLCIADVATGTGIWLVDVARTFPTAQLDGLDISLAQCPPKQWLPKNINLRVYNLYDDVPDDLRGKYDIVHIRSLVLVVQNDDPIPIIRNLVKMLKPNGYLQWEESFSFRAYITSIDPSVKTTALEEAVRDKAKPLGRWIPHLPETLMSEGFSDASLYHYQDHLSEIKAFFDCHLTAWEELLSNMSRDRTQEDKMSLKEVYEESKSGAVWCIPKVVCVAKKSG